MTNFAATSLSTLRKLFSPTAGGKAPEIGDAVVLDGMSAVAMIESRVSDSAGFGGAYPASIGARAWDQQARAGATSSGIHTNGPRSALAAAIGLSMSGQRATAFLAGPDLSKSHDLLTLASGQRLPLVIHVACREAAGHSIPIGSGHGPLHAAADCGFFQLFAINAQEAVDFAIIARRVSERSLIPGLVAMDAEQTASSAQQVFLPDDQLLADYLGDPSAAIKSPTGAQGMLFGESRRLVPRPFDIDAPKMLCPLQDRLEFGLGSAATRPYFWDHLPDILHEAFAEFAAKSGRQYSSTLENRASDAQIMLVAQGSAVETAIAFADHARSELRTKVGVLGIQSLRPFPAAEIARHLSGCGTIVVLERADTPAAGDGPLQRELRAALSREDSRSKGAPRFVNVPFGIGGLLLNAADLRALVARLSDSPPPTLYLGLDFVRTPSAYPKRQAMMDALRRRYPEVSELGVTGEGAPPDLRPSGAATLAICRDAGREHESMIADATALAHAFTGGHVRGKPDATWERFWQPCLDELVCAPTPIADPGDDSPIDIAVVASGQSESRSAIHGRLSDGGALIVAADSPEEALARAFPSTLKARCAGGSAKLYRVPLGEQDAPASNTLRTEALLGGLLSLLLTKQGVAVPTEVKLRQQRESMLTDVSDRVRATRIDAFITGFSGLEQVEITDEASFTSPTTDSILAEIDPKTPQSLVDELSKTWDKSALLRRAGQTTELAATPDAAMSELPPLSSRLNDVSTARSVIPVLDPETCDADPALWMSCPDGSIAPLVISAKALINRGIELAGEEGQPADALRAIAGQLAKRVNKVVSSSEAPPTTAAGLLKDAFQGLSQKASADDERQVAIRAALDAVIGVVGQLPLVRTKRFFDSPNNEKAGSGELFSIIVDPSACKCPELVLAECQGRGLKLVEHTDSSLESARRLHRLWLRLPDTSGETIERARNNPDIGPLAAIMLSRHCSLAMAGGDGAEPGSGAKLGLRLILGLAEYHLQPRQARVIAQIDEIQQKLKSRIDQMLSDALPAEDLGQLAESLGQLGGAEVDLASITQSLDPSEPQKRIQKAPLTNAVDLARALGDLRTQIAQGRFGIGRARSGVVMAPGATGSWAGVHPYNPFQSPSVIDATGESAPLAKGLLVGQIRRVLDGIRLLRRATLELDDPASASEHAKSLSSLTYADLTDKERALCPPMFVICDARGFAQDGLASLTDLLGEDLPVKFVVLSGAGGAIDSGLAAESFDPYPASERYDLAMLAMMARDMYVAQISPSHPDHFAQATLDAIAFDGPSLLHVYAPSPDRHGFPRVRVIERARVAVQSRAFPLLSYDPSREGVFGARLDISANPSPESTWANSEEPTTPIDWVIGEARFAAGFTPTRGDSKGEIPVAQYLELSAPERDEKTPVATNASDEDPEQLLVGSVLIADADGRIRFWRTLQELAGAVTPFTQRVQSEARRDVAEAHEADLAALRAEYEAKIAGLRAEFDAEATARVTQGLMSLAGYAPETTNGGPAQ